MVFTVGLPGVTRDYEFEAYLRVLEKKGINLAMTKRVADPVTKKRWLPAWADEAAAEDFATAIRRESGNNKWKVYSIDRSEPEGPLGPIEILLSRRSDGCTYSLSPASRKLIAKKFPKARLAPNVFVATTTQSDFELLQGPIWPQIAIILTGLKEEDLKELGSYRIVDSVGQRIVHEAPSIGT